MKNQKTSAYIKFLSISSSIIAIYIVTQLFTFSTEPSISANETPTFKNSYSIFSLKIPEGINFAGEKIPFEKHWVKESLDRELLVNTYWQSQTVLFIKRCNRYFPIIEPILKEHNIPDDFKYLAVIESGLMPRAISPAGAAGIWQFMRSTASEYGLEVNSEVDERYHLEKATVAACKYFKKSYASYQNWSLVAASYNAGKTGINRQLNLQKANNYYDLLLGEETGRYVYRIIALKEILSHPNRYGFYVDEEDLYPNLKTTKIVVDSTINNIADFAKSNGISYKEFKDLNPWLRKNKLSNSRKTKYEIDLPVQIATQQKIEPNIVPAETFVPNKISGNNIPLKTSGLQVQ
ncbi:Transglycosylase SLT domain-containing protein [Saccharicrinis carchari]|uniref:Transglycosylase SLT domain-containing protein n=1 Tax=Saccharicrinis carchari TaxID=1168039 RepID=A0A521D3B7_SACCC|nr:lytic transglycosylase domain-containing protein [Saccharicrinis carchari]SMO66178.1 Transglycosylase SLT domain-containing protein [Saccharicrinis carchari]